MSTVTHRVKSERPWTERIPPSDEKKGETQPEPANGLAHTLTELAALPTLAYIVLGQPLEASRLLALGVHQLAKQCWGSAFRPERDVVNQAGRVILITGGNIGLGRETVQEIAKHNPARIYLAARSEAKARRAIAELQSGQDAPLDIRHIPLDLSSFTSVRNAARIFLAENERLDTLILNAGIMGQDPYQSEDGYEIQFGTNYLGHFLLASLLLPILQRTASKPGSDVRVLSIASVGWQMAPSSPSTLLSLMTSTDRLLKCNRWTRYGISKAANILLASEMARRYPDIMTVSLHPGIILTALYDQGKAATFALKHGLCLLTPFASDEKNGARNHLWAAGCERSQLCNGEYYTPVGVQSWQHPLVHDEGTGRRLWEWAEEQVGIVS